MKRISLATDSSLIQPTDPASANGYIKWARLWIIVALCIAATNATLFTYSATTPLVANDSWYFLDTFVREYFNYTLDFKDFFVKREGSDHAQPINKLVLLFHLKYFGLDFTVEALIGLVFALIGCLLAIRVAWTGRLQSDRTNWLTMLGFAACTAAIPLLIFSLNSPGVFTWSLVTLAYILVGSAIGYFGIGALTLVGRYRAWPMFPASFLLAVVLDDLALVLTIAFAFICLLYAALTCSWKRSATIALVAIAGTMFYDLIVQPLLTPDIAATTTISSRTVGFFAENWMTAWKAVWLPATSMFVHPMHLEHAESTLRLLSVALPALCILLHVLFWARMPRKFRGRRPGEIVCAGLLLGFYGATTALVLTRVPTFGFDYLIQPRYYVFYLLGSLPIMISGAIAWRERNLPAPFEKLYLAATFMLAIGVTAAQWPLSVSSWDQYKYISEYTQRAAFQMGQLRDTPETTTACADILYACQYDFESKKRLIGLLTQHNLNVFNRSFQLRHRLYPDQASIPQP